MSNLVNLKTFPQGPGSWLDINVDKSKPDGAFEQYITELTTEGKEDSVLINVPPHWHKLHDEYMTVVEGVLEVTLEGKKNLVRPEDGPFFIPRYHWHSLKSFKGVRTVVREVPNPLPMEKVLFFNDVFSGSQGFPSFWRFVRACYDGDTVLHLPGNFKLLEQAFTYSFGLIAKLFVPPKVYTL